MLKFVQVFFLKTRNIIDDVEFCSQNIFFTRDHDDELPVRLKTIVVLWKIVVESHLLLS